MDTHKRYDNAFSPPAQPSWYERLHTPVPATEATVCNTLFNSNACIGTLNRNAPSSTCKTQQTEVFPITSSLEIHPCIPPVVWQKFSTRPQVISGWASAIRGYTQLHTAGSYERVILHNQPDTQWPLRLFGVEHNALQPVLMLASLAHNLNVENADNFILHYISMIVLQFYLMERDQFMQATVSAADASHNARFDESMPPYLLQLYMRYDIKRQGFPICLAHEPDCLWSLQAESRYHSESKSIGSKSGESKLEAKAEDSIHNNATGVKPEAAAQSLAEAAKQYDYISLVYSVLVCLAPALNAWQHKHTQAKQPLTISTASIEDWCDHKIFTTKTQMLVTSRFVPMHVREFSHQIKASMELLGTPDENTFIRDGETKPYKHDKNHKMRYPDLLRKDPLRNNRAQRLFDVKNSGANSLAIHQIRIPFFWTHFFFSPVRSCSFIRVDALPASIEKMWRPACDEDAERLQFFVYHTLQQTGIMLDLTLTGCIGKAVNRVHEKLAKHFVVSKTPPPPFSIMHNASPLRLRYAYIIQDYQMQTNIAQALQAPCSPEWSPQWLSEPAWCWLCTRSARLKLVVPPLNQAQQTLVFEPRDDYRRLRVAYDDGQTDWLDAWMDRSPAAPQPGSFDYACAGIVAQCWLQTHKANGDIDKTNGVAETPINWALLFRGLVALMRSEQKAVDQLRLLYYKNVPRRSAETNANFQSATQDFFQLTADDKSLLHRLQHDQQAAEHEVESIVNQVFEPHDEEASNAFRLACCRWTHSADHVECVPTAVEWQTMLSPRTYAHRLNRLLTTLDIPHLTRHQPASTRDDATEHLLQRVCQYLACNDASAKAVVDAEEQTVLWSPQGTYHWKVCDLYCWLLMTMYHQSSVLAGYFALKRPPPVIPCSPASLQSQQTQAFERIMPRSFKLLHKQVSEIRSDAFMSELTKAVQLLKADSNFQLPPIAAAELNSSLYLLQYIHRSNATPVEGKEKRLIELLTFACRCELSEGDRVVPHAQRMCIAEAVKKLNAHTHFCDQPIDSLATKLAIEHLSVCFKPHEVPEALLTAIEQCRSNKAVLEFKAQCSAARNQLRDAKEARSQGKFVEVSCNKLHLAVADAMLRRQNINLVL